MTEKKVVLITGASGGIGAATARLIAQRGMHPIIHFFSNEAAAKKMEQLIINENGTCDIYKADLTNKDETISLFQWIKSKYQKLHGIVNNSGVSYSLSKFVDMDIDRWRNIFDLNVISAMHCSKLAIPLMSIQNNKDGGSIVNVSSVAALLGSPNEYVDYAATKGALDTFTVGLAKELASEGIRVNGVRPGLIYTPFHEKSNDPNRVDRLIENVPMKRGGQPEEIAEAIYWLLSDASSYATGTIINVSGGR